MAEPRASGCGCPILLLLVIAIPGVLGAAWATGLISSLLAAVLLAGVVVLLVLMPLAGVKHRLLAHLPRGFRAYVANPDFYPALDQESLDHYTVAVEALGFRHAMDYRVEPEAGDATPAFARLYVHPEHACYAEVHQVFPPQHDPTPMRCVLVSCLANDWHLSTTDHDPDPAIALLRRPTSLWICRPGASPEELLRLLLSLRAQVAADLGLGVVGDLSAEAYFEENRKNATARWEMLRGRSVLSIVAEMKRFQRSPISEWMGDYPRLARERKAERA